MEQSRQTANHDEWLVQATPEATPAGLAYMVRPVGAYAVLPHEAATSSLTCL